VRSGCGCTVLREYDDGQRELRKLRNDVPGRAGVLGGRLRDYVRSIADDVRSGRGCTVLCEYDDGQRELRKLRNDVPGRAGVLGGRLLRYVHELACRLRRRVHRSIDRQRLLRRFRSLRSGRHRVTGRRLRSGHRVPGWHLRDHLPDWICDLQRRLHRSDVRPNVLRGHQWVRRQCPGQRRDSVSRRKRLFFWELPAELPSRFGELQRRVCQPQL